MITGDYLHYISRRAIAMDMGRSMHPGASITDGAVGGNSGLPAPS